MSGPTDAMHDYVLDLTGVDPRTAGKGALDLTEPKGLSKSGGAPALPALKVVTPQMAASCRRYLKDHDFAAQLLPDNAGIAFSSYQPAIDDKPATIEDVAASLLPLTLQLPGALGELTDLVRFQYGTMVAVAITAAKDRQDQAARRSATYTGVPSPSVTLSPDTPADKTQIVTQVGVAYAVHANVDGSKPDTPADYTLQLTFAKNTLHHKDGEAGAETQILIQFGYNFTNGQPTILGGVQEAWVVSFFNGLVQASAFVQALQGISLGGTAKGTFKFNPATQIQPSAGAQLQLQVGPISIFVQPAVSYTDTQGSTPTLDRGITGGIGGTF